MRGKKKVWQIPQPTYRQLLWNNIAPSLVLVLSKVPFIRKGVRYLHESISFHPNNDIFDAVKPNDVELEMQKVAFVDYVCVEDYPKLMTGLKSMQRKYKSRFNHVRDSQHVFSQFEKNDPNITRWAELDSLYLANDSELANYMDIHLYWLSPSTVLLCFIVEPSDQFKQRFQGLLTQQFETKKIVTPSAVWSALVKKSWRISHYDPSRQRTDTQNQLVLELNHEVCRILNKNLCIGWSSSRPLPTLEVITLKSGSPPIPNAPERFFWHSIGIETADYYTYQKDGIFLIQQEKDELQPSIYSSYKIFVDKNKYMQGRSTDGYQSEDSALYHGILYDFLVSYFVATGLREHIKNLVEQISAVRSEVAPELVRQSSHFFPMKIWKRMSVNLFRLNQLDFELKRTGIDVKFDDLPRGMLSDLKGFVSEWKPNEKREFLDALKPELKRNWEYATAQVESLRATYRARFDVNMQWAVLILTLITVLLAVLNLPQWAVQFLSDSKSAVASEGASLLELIKFYISQIGQ